MQIFSPFALILGTLSIPSQAQAPQAGPEHYAITLAAADLGSSTPAMAHRALHRIDRAATMVCGGAAGSLREVTKAVQATACWRDAVSDTVRRIDAPLLSQAWQDRHGPGRGE